MLESSVKEEIFHLTSKEANVTETDISTGQTSLWLEGWRWQVPVGQSIIFLPSHTFSLFAKDIATSELTIDDLFRIVVKDASQQDAKQILGSVRYTALRSFQDKNLIRHLDLSKPLIVNEDQWIVIEGYMAISLDVSLSWFDLTCQRIRHAIL